MAYQLTGFTVALLATAFVSSTLAMVAYRHRDQRMALPLVGVMVATVFWCVADGMRIASTTESTKLFRNNVRFLGPTLVVPWVFLLAAEFSNREQWLTRRRVALLAIPELLTNVAVWTNPLHGLVRSGTALTADPGYVAIEITYGPIYWVQATYHYAVLIVATVWFVNAYRRARKQSTGMYERQAGLMLTAVLIPGVRASSSSPDSPRWTPRPWRSPPRRS